MFKILSGKHCRLMGIFLTGFFLFEILVSFNSRNVTPEQRTTQLLEYQLTVFHDFVKDTLLPLTEGNSNEKDLQTAFLKARRYYKSVEWATEYFTYGTAKQVNGAPKEEAEIAGQTITQPHGLQLMETYLFPHYDRSNYSQLRNEVKLLQQNISFFQRYFENIDLSAWQIMDALKLEIFRIETLGITGFDDALTLKSIAESAIALQGVKNALNLYHIAPDLETGLRNAIRYLWQHQDFNSFDRAYFIRHFANPISSGIEWYVRQNKLGGYQYNRLLRQNVFTLFDNGAFDAKAYSPFLNQPLIAEKITLGKKLFSDPVFSGNGTRSCASCHIPEQAYANQLVLEKTIDGKGWIDRNTPTLINTALQPQQFYDQRAQNIEDQIVDVIHNPKEMNGSLEKAIKLLSGSSDFQRLYHAAFPHQGKIDRNDIVEALAAYVRSLVRLNSRFDAYMRGEDLAMNADEIAGFNLFMGKAQCATCHYMPLFSGVFPPKYITQDTEILGIPATADGKKLDRDLGFYIALLTQGLYSASSIRPFQHAFKTVSVRNASKTAPYMHNGVFATLEEVMDFYNKGGGKGEGLNITNQSLSEQPLHLSPKEVAQIIAFMKTLDSH